MQTKVGEENQGCLLLAAAIAGKSGNELDVGAHKLFQSFAVAAVKEANDLAIEPTGRVDSVDFCVTSLHLEDLNRGKHAHVLRSDDLRLDFLI